jgi:F0F1-type ATP synthase assembly protein I
MSKIRGSAVLVLVLLASFVATPAASTPWLALALLLAGVMAVVVGVLINRARSVREARVED